MNAERVREFLLGLPHVVETAQWGGIVFWVGDKAIGGKMFVILNTDAGELPISYPVGQERMAELVELDGIVPAPYMARIFWVAAERWSVFRMSEWESELTAAHAMTFAKLPPKTTKVLAMAKSEQRKIVAERRKVLGERAKTKTSAYTDKKDKTDKDR
jgi:predicted DNA-binding protein (MmcQ/YjbR family)